MNSSTNSTKSNLVRKTTALLSAIAASSFLGLPAFAQANSNTPSTNESQYIRNQENRNNSDSNRMSADCVPARTNQSSSMTQPDSSSTSPDAASTSTASAPGPDNRQFSNQTDPRTIAPTESSMRGTEGTSSSNQTGTQNSSTMNQNAESGTVRSGDVPYGSRTSENRSTDQTVTTPVAPSGETSQGGVGGPVDSSSSQSTDSSSTQTATSDTRDYGYTHALYQNVLARGGSTTGGGARQLVESANNRDRQPDEFGNVVSYRNRDGEYQASAYGQTQTSDNQIQTSGVTSGGETMSSSTPNSTNTMSSDSTTQSSRMTPDNRIASCPPGTVPRQSVPNQGQQSPDQSSPSQTTPDSREVPGRANPGGNPNP